MNENSNKRDNTLIFGFMSSQRELERSIFEKIKNLKSTCKNLRNENSELRATIASLQETLEKVKNTRKPEDVAQIKKDLASFSNQINDCLQIVEQLTEEYDGNEQGRN